MAVYEIGKKIRRLRESRGMTQEELSDGVCATGTLSKIENGVQAPKKRTFMALMKKLGGPEYLYSIHLDEEEMQEMRKCREIGRSIWSEDYDRTEELLHQYKLFLEENEISESQGYRMMCASLHAKQRMNPNQVVQEFEDALRVKRKDYPRWIPEKVEWIAFEEIFILNNIAVQYCRLGEKEKAFSYLKWLIAYLEYDNMDEGTLARVYPAILCNYAELLWEQEQYEEAYKVTLEGIRLCKEYTKLMVLPNLFRTMARILELRGEKEEAQRYLTQAESLLYIMACYKELKEFRKDNKENFALLLYM